MALATTESANPVVRCTLTGVDRHTPPSAAQALLDRPGVELALLLSLDHTTPRFVTPSDAQTWLERLHGPVALHLCGPSIRQALLRGALAGLVARASRVQVNGPVQLSDAHALRQALSPAAVFITQHGPGLPDLTDLVLPGHALLVDASSGEGRLPQRWQRPATEKPVGFAGGLTAANLGQQLNSMAAVATSDFWIDTETALRDAQDRFDPERGHAFVDAAQAWARSHAIECGQGLHGVA